MTTPSQPGFYLYTDPIGAPPERIQVVRDGDELCARFDDGGDVELLPIADMAGTWETAR